MPQLGTGGVARHLRVPFDGPERPLRALAIDSRRVGAGDLFVAVAGARVDGHDFVEAAAGRGAVAAIVERPLEASVPCIRVPDSLAALSALGFANRELYEGVLIAVTGSCGKTSVKNMCLAILEQVAPTVATAGNYNNELGVPLTLSRLDATTRFAVIEMGATRRGDVAHLCDLARPGISTVLNAMEAHLEGFGSVADVADVKAEIFDGLGGQGIAVVNLDQPWAGLWRERARSSGARVVTCAIEQAAEVRASALRDYGLAGSAFKLQVQDRECAVRLPVPGRHNVANALAAAALAHAAGVDIDAIARGLASVRLESGRLQSERLANGVTLIDDSYNANPGSVRAALDLLAATPGRRAIVLGEMLELGTQSEARHREMGERARELGIDRFVGVGQALRVAAEAFGVGAEWVADKSDLPPLLPSLLADSDIVLVKGSRGAAMEEVLEQLRAAAEVRSC